MKHDLVTQSNGVADAAPDDLQLDDRAVPCEVCAATASSGSGATEPRAFGARVFWLCAAHRAPAEHAASADALRTLFQEPGGQRCVLPRRAEDRRLFPPRPEGRRKGAGRRRADPST